VAVNKGTPYETLSKQMAEKVGFTVQVYDTQPDATQAVLSGRAYATLGGNTTIVYAASKNPNFIADLELKETRAHWAAPVPKNNPKLRAELQDALDCMKKDGTIAKLMEKWFGKKPEPDDLAVVITPGYGVPGMPGYDPTPHELHCG
jgi:polar amino acid transport system substrate-binding protein